MDHNFLPFFSFFFCFKGRYVGNGNSSASIIKIILLQRSGKWNRYYLRRPLVDCKLLPPGMRADSSVTIVSRCSLLELLVEPTCISCDADGIKVSVWVSQLKFSLEFNTQNDRHLNWWGLMFYFHRSKMHRSQPVTVAIHKRRTAIGKDLSSHN